MSLNAAPKPSMVWNDCESSTVRFTLPEDTGPRAMPGCGVNAWLRSDVVSVTPIVPLAACAGAAARAATPPVTASVSATACALSLRSGLLMFMGASLFTLWSGRLPSARPGRERVFGALGPRHPAAAPVHGRLRQGSCCSTRPAADRSPAPHRVMGYGERVTRG